MSGDHFFKRANTAKGGPACQNLPKSAKPLHKKITDIHRYMIHPARKLIKPAQLAFRRTIIALTYLLTYNNGQWRHKEFSFKGYSPRGVWVPQ